MKIVMCTPSFGGSRNGIATVSRALATELAARGCDIIVLTTGDETIAERVSERIEVRTFRAQGKGALHDPARGDKKSYRATLTSIEADVVLFVCWEAWTTTVARPVLSAVRGVTVLASHGTTVTWRPKGWRSIRPFLWYPFRITYRSLIRAFDHIVLLADEIENNRFYDRVLLERMGLAKWSVIPNGTWPDLFEGEGSSFAAHYGIECNQFVLCVSNYQWIKNQELALQVFRKARLNNANLVFIGSHATPYLTRLQNKYGYNSEIRFLYGIPDDYVRSAYRCARLFLLTSRTEVQPLVLLDSMAAGLPFVATDVGAVRQLPGGIVGRDEQGLASHLARLWHDRQAREALAEAGKRAIRSEYNWKRIGEKYAKLFEELLRNRLESGRRACGGGAGSSTAGGYLRKRRGKAIS